MKRDMSSRTLYEYGWDSLADVVIDAHGRTVLASHDNELNVLCFDPSGTQLWSCIVPMSSEARLTPLPDGRVLAWQAGRHSAVVIDATGNVTGKLGQREGPGIVALDLADAEDLLACADGTLLLSACNRLTRFSATGVAMPTWPQSSLWHRWFPQKPKQLYLHESEQGQREKNQSGDDAASYWSNRPMVVDDDDVIGLVTGDALILVSTDGSSDCIGKFAADGSRLWSVKVKDVQRKRPGVDGQGNVYVVVETSAGSRRQVWQIPSEGGKPFCFLNDWRDGGPVIDPKCITVTPSGTVGLWDSYSAATWVSADGTIRHTSEAESNLASKRRERKRRIDRDEDPE